MAKKKPEPEMKPLEPSQAEKTRQLHDALAEVINTHPSSPETILMALELLKQQALGPRVAMMGAP